MSGRNEYAWWKNGLVRASVVSTLIFLTGIGIGREMPRRVADELPDYSIGNDYWRMTWDFKKERPEGSENYILEKLVIRYFAANFALATMATSDSSVNKEMLARLLVYMKIASERNIITADSVIKTDFLADIERNRTETDSIR